MNDKHYDVIIIGTGAGGGTLAYRLAPSGKKILLIERGDFLPREKENWDPDAVFVGGTGRQVGPVLNEAYARLASGGRMVVNVVTIDGLAAAHETLKKLAGQVSVWNVSVARGIEQMDRVRFESMNPTFLLAVTKNPDAAD